MRLDYSLYCIVFTKAIDLLQDMSQSSSTSSGLGYRHSTLQETFKIVSEQSTSRPGCIIELDSIMEAHHVC